MFRTGDECELDIQTHTLRNMTQNKTFVLKPLGDILPILEAGDIFQYAKRSGMMKVVEKNAHHAPEQAIED